jgi:hypothetical protein
MGFQSSVFINMAAGVPGEMAFNAPHVAEPYTIVSALASYNLIGSTACTITAQGFCQAGAGSTTQTSTLNSTTAVTGLTSTASLSAGYSVVGTGIPVGTTIASITNATSLVLSAAATVTGAQSLQFTPPNLGFAGFLVDPKAVALFGVSNQPLSPTLQVPNYTLVECLTQGKIFVTLPAACNIGDKVVYNKTTGAISTIAPEAALATGTSFANAIVDSFTPNASGSQLAVIWVNPTYVIPA